MAVAIVGAGDAATVGPYRVVWTIATICAVLAAVIMLLLFPRNSVRTEAIPAEDGPPVASIH